MDTLPKARVSFAAPVTFDDGSCAVLSVFDGLVDGRTDHISISFAGLRPAIPLIRVHSECLTGDVFGSLRCDCGSQLQEACARCRSEGGSIIYLRQEGRGIGLANKIASYALQDQGLNTFEANRVLGHQDDERDFGVAAQMLTALGFNRIRLLSNNPEKRTQLERFGVEVVRLERTVVGLSPYNRRYLTAKRDQAGHFIDLSEGAGPSTDPKR